MNITFIGGGNMAAAIIGGLLQKGWRASQLRAVEISAPAREKLEQSFKVRTHSALDSEAANTDCLVLAVKPQTFPSVVESARTFVGENTRVLSIMAGVTMDTLSRDLAAPRVIRCVPNTPARIGRGVTAYVASPACTAEDRRLIEQLLEPLGAVEPIAAERLMDVVTAVSGSGPAYVFLLAEVLAAAAEQEGLDRDAAMRLASRTVAGAGALMLETADSPSTLRKQVSSPGGTTEAALDVLSAADGLAPLLRRAVSAAAARSRELGRGGNGQ